MTSAVCSNQGWKASPAKIGLCTRPRIKTWRSGCRAPNSENKGHRRSAITKNRIFHTVGKGVIIVLAGVVEEVVVDEALQEADQALGYQAANDA